MKLLSIEEIREKGIEALNKSLGPIGMIRFIQELNSGYGNYTKDRYKWQDRYSIEDIFNEITRKKQKNKISKMY